MSDEERNGTRSGGGGGVLGVGLLVVTGFFLAAGGPGAVAKQWRNLGGGKEERVTYDALAVHVPLYEEPPLGSRACQTLWPEQIPDSLVAIGQVRERISGNGVLAYTLLWTGERAFFPLRHYDWPEGISRVRLEISHVRGHLDVSNRHNPATGEHATIEVTKRRDYGRMTYCLGLERSYPYYQTLRNFWGPAQTALVLDPQRPRKGLYPFTEGSVTLEVRKGDNPQLLFNNHGPPNGRRHLAEFRVVIGREAAVAPVGSDLSASTLGTAHLPSGVVRGTPTDIQWGVRCTADCPSERKQALLRRYSNSRSCFTQTAVRVDERGYSTAVATLQSSGDPGCDRAQEAWMAEARWEARGEPYWLAYDTAITL